MGPYSGFVTCGSYLAFAVDSRGIMNSPAIVGRDQGVEVFHPVGAIVEEGMLLAGASVRSSNHLPGVVYGLGIAVSTTEGTKVFHPVGAIVEEGMPSISNDL